MKCTHYNNTIEQGKCIEFKPNHYWRCKFMEDCPKGKKSTLKSSEDSMKDVLRDYGSDWFNDSGYT